MSPTKDRILIKINPYTAVDLLLLIIIRRRSDDDDDGSIEESDEEEDSSSFEDDDNDCDIRGLFRCIVPPEVSDDDRLLLVLVFLRK